MMALKIDSDGWIEGITEYAGCGSHSCAWISDSGKSLLIHAPDLLEALEEIADGDGCNCRVGPGCDWKCKDIAHAAITKVKSAR